MSRFECCAEECSIATRATTGKCRFCKRPRCEADDCEAVLFAQLDQDLGECYACREPFI